MIKIQDLTFWYTRNKSIVEHLDLQLENGHIYGLLGKNGAGKTTLLKLLTGLTFPKSGTIFLDGKDSKHRDPELLREMFLVPEEVSLPSLTAVKFAEIYGSFYPGFDQAMFLENLGKFEVEPGQKNSSMSLGQKRKTLISFGLAANTRYLFLDEPTNGLDIPSKAALRSLLAGSFLDEKLVILSTHMVRDLASLIDSVLILEDRKIVLNHSLDRVSRKLSFGRSSLAKSPDEIIYSAIGEMGPTLISANASGIPGQVDIEALFQACLAEPVKIKSCIES